MSMKKVYLAIPYSHKRKAIRGYRFEVACRIAKLLTLQGYLVVCPVIPAHHMKLPTDWEFWKKHDISFLEWCDELWIIMLPGWKQSKGTQSEIQVANLLNKKIVFIEPDYE